MGKSQRTKGHNYERELARVFREVMPGADAKRGLQSRGGGEVPDVDIPYFWIEAKRGKKPNPRAALQQAIGDAAESQNGDGQKVPVAVIRDDHQEAFVAMRLSDFLSFVGEWWKSRAAI